MKPVKVFLTDDPILTVVLALLISSVVTATQVEWSSASVLNVASIIGICVGGVGILIALIDGILKETLETALRARKDRYWATANESGRIQIMARENGRERFVASFDVSEDEAAADRLRELRHMTATQQVDLTEAKRKAKMVNRITR